MLPAVSASIPSPFEISLVTYGLAIVGTFTLIEMIGRKLLWVLRELTIGAIDHYYDVVDHLRERRARSFGPTPLTPPGGSQ